MAYQGQHPVIFLTLKRVKGSTFEKAFAEIKEEISKLFEIHRAVLSYHKVTDTQKEQFMRYIRKEATEAEYKSSLQFLSRLLSLQADKQVYIL